MANPPTRFSDIPQLIDGGSYAVDVSWSYLEEWLKSHDEGPGGRIVDMDPDFQRGHVWSEAKQVAYVEFILRGGTSANNIWWNCKGWSKGAANPLLLVDGKQRIEAVRKFLRNDLAIFRQVYNAGLKREDFSDNPGIVSARFRMNVNDLKTRKEVLQWYLEINSGGVIHTEDEIVKVQRMLDEELKKGKS